MLSENCLGSTLGQFRGLNLPLLPPMEIFDGFNLPFGVCLRRTPAVHSQVQTPYGKGGGGVGGKLKHEYFLSGIRR